MRHGDIARLRPRRYLVDPRGGRLRRPDRRTAAHPARRGGAGAPARRRATRRCGAAPPPHREGEAHVADRDRPEAPPRALTTPIAQYRTLPDGMEVVAGYSYSGPAADGIEIIELAAEEDAVCGVHLGSMERIAESWHAIHTEVVAGRQDGGMIRAVLFDLDGVIRHFDHDTTLEARHGLADGAIARTAFSSPLIDEVTTGLLTREEWIIRVGEAAGSAAAAQEWGRTPFAADRDVLALVDAVRSHGTTCAILTNGTDTIDEELRDSGIDAHFDRVFNSADIGHAKPDVRAFRHVVAALDLPPEEVFFLDDSPGKLSGARALGMTTHHFTGVAALRTALHVAGVPGATAPTPIP